MFSVDFGESLIDESLLSIDSGSYIGSPVGLMDDAMKDRPMPGLANAAS